MPPAGLEPAALCLASSIRLSLTARQSWGCWLDYILDITVPTRIVSEDPCANELLQVSCGLPNPHGLLLEAGIDSSTGGSQGVPAYRVVHSMGSRPHFPIKAPTRQMLYPLSYRGTFKGRMLARQIEGRKKAQTKRDRPRGATSFRRITRLSLRCAGVFFGFCEHATAVQRIINDLADSRCFRVNVHSVARF